MEWDTKQKKHLQQPICNLDFPLPNFLSILERTFCWASSSFSSLSPSQSNTLQKVFPPHFLFFFFPIFSKIHSTKHNLNLSILKKKKLREREIIAPLLTGLERFDHQSSTKGCRRLVDAKFWVITIWTLWLCNRKFLVFSSSIWRDLVKRFYFFEKAFWRSSYSYTTISFWFFVSIDHSFTFWGFLNNGDNKVLLL